MKVEFIELSTYDAVVAERDAALAQAEELAKIFGDVLSDKEMTYLEWEDACHKGRAALLAYSAWRGRK